MAVSPEFRAFVEDQIGRVTPVRTRPMFGGLGLYTGDLFFAVVDDDVLYFKVDDTTRPRYEKRRMRPFNPMGTPMNGYWQVPAGVIEDLDELASWVREAVEVRGPIEGETAGASIEGVEQVEEEACLKPARLDVETWPRREHYELFRSYDNPWFNLCADVDVSALHARSKLEGTPSFFAASLWCSLAAANEIEEFRYRIRDEGVVVHPVIHGGSTVLVPDGTFRFAYYDFDADVDRFSEHVAGVLERVKLESGPLDPQDDRDDLIHYSVIPWVSFTSFSHARRWGTGDAVPKIVFGKHREVGGRRLMPVSVEVHHALVDGLHVGRFYEAFQRRLDGAGV